MEVKKHIDVQLVSDSLIIKDCLDFIADPAAGAQCLFTGTVRNHSHNKTVKYLEYSAYKPMAEKELVKICKEAMISWPVLRIAVHHRTGHLDIGDLAVIVAVCSAHRKDAFESCQWIMDSIKKTVPIWKKEVFDGGEEWVGAM